MSDVLESAIVFDCAGDSLVGIVHMPEKNVRRIGVIVVVGGPQYRVGSHRQFTLMARALAEAGYPVLRFDYRGMGDSGGAVRAFDQVDDDIAAAIQSLTHSAPSIDGVVLWGLCDAASACMIYGARKDHRVKGLILANPWVRTTASEASSYLKHYYLRRLLQRSFWAKVFGGAFNVRRSLGELLGTVKKAQSSLGSEQSSLSVKFIDRMLGGIRGLRSPSLFLLSGRDLTAREFEDLCNRDSAWRAQLLSELSSRVSCPRADHTFSSRDDLSFAVSECSAWLDTLLSIKT